MNIDPRRIGALKLCLRCVRDDLGKNKTILERVATSSILSLHPEIEKRISFNWK
jgi:hypothetical protein